MRASGPRIASYCRRGRFLSGCLLGTAMFLSCGLAATRAPAAPLASRDLQPVSSAGSVSPAGLLSGGAAFPRHVLHDVSIADNIALPRLELAALSPAQRRARGAEAAAPAGFGGRVSGLRWASGSTAGPLFGEWRGRPQDIHNIFASFNTWDEALRLPGWALTRRLAASGRLSVGLGLLSREQRLNFAACVGGQNDARVRTFVRGLRANGADNAIIRLGWEMNASSFPWGVGRIPNAIPLYRQCFARIANIIRSEAPDMLIEWPPRRETERQLSLESIYPGDEFVDIIGVLYYDWWPAAPTEAEWNRAIVQRDRRGGPKGLATWLDFAQQRGKPLSVPEWGIGKHGDLDPFDNPLFIEKMYEFFYNNFDGIAYETYFNGWRHRIFAAGEAQRVVAPRSAATYRRLYSRTERQ